MKINFFCSLTFLQREDFFYFFLHMRGGGRNIMEVITSIE